jgi:hypothetical protein
MLLDQGADVAAQDSEGRTPEDTAAAVLRGPFDLYASIQV